MRTLKNAQITIASMTLILLTLIVTAFAVGNMRAEADELRAKLTEAEKQKVVVIEEAQSSTSQANADEPLTTPVVQVATRQERVPEDAEIVHADELLGMTSLGKFTVTHYCTCVQCCGKTNGITASGRQAVPYYSIAVDPSVIPLGTVVCLDYGDGVLHEARADDTGGAITGYKMDLCVGDHQAALQLGIRTATVYRMEVAK